MCSFVLGGRHLRHPRSISVRRSWDPTLITSAIHSAPPHENVDNQLPCSSPRCFQDAHLIFAPQKLTWVNLPLSSKSCGPSDSDALVRSHKGTNCSTCLSNVAEQPRVDRASCLICSSPPPPFQFTITARCAKLAYSCRNRHLMHRRSLCVQAKCTRRGHRQTRVEAMCF